MKQRFNTTGSQTYTSREEELEAHAKKIDEFLRTPQMPGVHFTPSGEMRKNGSKAAHQALTQKRIDISKELEAVRLEQNKRHTEENLKSKTI